MKTAIWLKTSRSIEQFSDWTGRCISWLTLLIVVLMTSVVALRYLLEFGNIALQESVMYLHGAIFLLGASYTLKHNEHVRVDIFYNRLSERGQAWVNLIGTLLLLMPTCILIFYVSLDYVLVSWERMEGSPDAGGLPLLYLLKSLLLVMPVLLFIQGLSDAIQAGHTLAGKRTHD